MNFPGRSVVVLVLLAAGLGACRRPPDAQAVAAVKGNLRAFVKGDAALARATTHPANPLFGNIDAIMAEVRPLDLDYQLERCEVAGGGPWEVRVAYVQVTRKKSAATKFRDNRVTGEHVLRLDHGAWKIRFSQIRLVEYLDR